MYKQFCEDIAECIRNDKRLTELPSLCVVGDSRAAELSRGALELLGVYNEGAENAIAFDEPRIPEAAKRAVVITASRRTAERLIKATKRASLLLANEEDKTLYVTDLLRLALYVLIKGKAGGIYSEESIKRSGFERLINAQDAGELYSYLESKSSEVFVFSDAKSEQFKALQQCELMILAETDRVCRENGISYSLAGGTLLGAVRHKGFIPWDYDIDIMMSPESFRRFCRLSDKFSDKFFLQTPATDKGNYFFTKVRLNGTLMTTDMTDKLNNIHNGIFIDVFCHSYTARTKPLQRLHRTLTRCARSLVYNKWNGTIVRGAKGSNVSPLVRGFATVLKTLLPMRLLCAFQRLVIDFFRHDTGYMYDGWGQHLSAGAFPSKWFKEYTTLEFEGKAFPVIAEYEKYLHYLYGSYEELPTLSQRHISHDIIRLELGEGINK